MPMERHEQTNSIKKMDYRNMKGIFWQLRSLLSSRRAAGHSSPPLLQRYRYGTRAIILRTITFRTDSSPRRWPCCLHRQSRAASCSFTMRLVTNGVSSSVTRRARSGRGGRTAQRRGSLAGIQRGFRLYHQPGDYSRTLSAHAEYARGRRRSGYAGG